MYLLYNGQRIAKKKTHVKKRTVNPVFNESFVFDVPYNEGLHNLSIELLMLDWDRVTKNEVIGRLELGAKVGCFPSMEASIPVLSRIGITVQTCDASAKTWI